MRGRLVLLAPPGGQAEARSAGAPPAPTRRFRPLARLQPAAPAAARGLRARARSEGGTRCSAGAVHLVRSGGGGAMAAGARRLAPRCLVRRSLACPAGACVEERGAAAHGGGAARVLGVPGVCAPRLARGGGGGCVAAAGRCRHCCCGLLPPACVSAPPLARRG